MIILWSKVNFRIWGVVNVGAHIFRIYVYIYTPNYYQHNILSRKNMIILVPLSGFTKL